MISIVWLNMLRKRNTVVHIYDKNEADDLVLLIKNSFIPELRKLLDILEEKDNKINEDAL